MPRIAGFRLNPAVPESTLVRYASPAVVFFDRCPPVGLREAAGRWKAAVRRQSSWTNYVFGEDPVFPKERPIVLFSPPADAHYSDHAALLAPEPRLVFLEDAALARAAALAGAETLSPVDDLSPEDARARCGLGLSSLAVGDGFAEFGDARETLVAVVGPRHDDASAVYRRTLAAVLDATDADPDDRDRLVVDALADGDAALLDQHAIYLCTHGTLIPLATVSPPS